MTDFNPHSRNPRDFVSPPPSRNLLSRAENYLISVLAMPGWIRGIDISHFGEFMGNQGVGRFVDVRHRIAPEEVY